MLFRSLRLSGLYIVVKSALVDCDQPRACEQGTLRGGWLRGQKRRAGQPQDEMAGQQNLCDTGVGTRSMTELCSDHDIVVGGVAPRAARVNLAGLTIRPANSRFSVTSVRVRVHVVSVGVFVTSQVRSGFHGHDKRIQHRRRARRGADRNGRRDEVLVHRNLMIDSRFGGCDAEDRQALAG